MTLPAGTKLGPYEIISPLGSGGMGEVYRARDTRLARDVAVKVLPERLARDKEARARFEREARAVAALSHPNILEIHDFGVEDGIAYVVTELLEGETLRARLDAGPLPIPRAVEYALKIAEALGAAHDKTIVHRDVKPENVFVTRDDRIKVLDFGVAKRSGEPLLGGASSSADTAPGVLVGTIGYMSPEQARTEPLDGRSDLFSLGCVLYEMITGARAFRRESPADTLAAILKEDPAPIDVRATGCPVELARLVTRCLAKSREARFQSARDLAFALAASLRTAPPARARNARSRRRIDSIAVLPFANGGGSADLDYLVDGLTEDVINTLARRAKSRVVARSTVFRYKGLALDPRVVGGDLDVAAVVTGRVTVRGGEIDVQAELVDVADGAQLWGERFRRPAASLLALEEEISSAIARRVSAQPGRRKKAAPARAASAEAYDLYLKGRYLWNLRTEEGFEKALALFREAIALDPQFALAYAGVADAYTFLGGYGHMPVGVAYPRAREAAERALALADIPEAHNSLATVLHRWVWDFAGAEREFRRVIVDDPSLSTAHHWFSLFLLTMGRFAEAREEVERARALDPLSLVVWEDWGYWLYCRREFRDAAAEFRKLLDLDAGFQPARFDLAIALALGGVFDEAVAEARRAVAAVGDRPRPRTTLAWVLAAAGRSGEARTILETLGDAHAFGRALVRTALGETDAAFAELDRALADREDALVSLLVNPRVDPLRADARFPALLAKVGLPPAAEP